jgi:hypothetical protein
MSDSILDIWEFEQKVLRDVDKFPEATKKFKRGCKRDLKIMHYFDNSLIREALKYINKVSPESIVGIAFSNSQSPSLSICYIKDNKLKYFIIAPMEKDYCYKKFKKIKELEGKQ